MSKNPLLTTPRQLQLKFEEDDVWERLPASVRCKCQALVTQLLIQVMRQETEQTREPGNERQD